jgi:hypothetical protein
MGVRIEFALRILVCDRGQTRAPVGRPRLGRGRCAAKLRISVCLWQLGAVASSNSSSSGRSIQLTELALEWASPAIVQAHSLITCTRQHIETALTRWDSQSNQARVLAGVFCAAAAAHDQRQVDQQAVNEC